MAFRGSLIKTDYPLQYIIDRLNETYDNLMLTAGNFPLHGKIRKVEKSLMDLTIELESVERDTPEGIVGSKQIDFTYFGD